MSAKKSLFLGIAVLALAGLSSAQNVLSNQVTIAHAAGKVRWSQCAFTPDGVIHVIWEDDYTAGNTIWYANYDGKTISTPFNVSVAANVFAERPHITASRKGLVGVTWGQSGQNSVYMRILDWNTKTWGAVETVYLDEGYSEPVLAIDDNGNIFATWFEDAGGIQWSRAKINGQWEGLFKLSSDGVTSKQGWITSAPDGKIWAVWREKRVPTAYINVYNKRSKDSTWSTATVLPVGEHSMSHPFLTTHPDSTPYIAVGDVIAETELGQTMFVQKIDEITNPGETALPYGVHHYPQLAITPKGDFFLACPYGGGDYGDGIEFTYRLAGTTTWSFHQKIPSTWPKVVGCVADLYGNVGVCYSDHHISQGGSDIYVNSIVKIVPFEYAPTNPGLTMRLSGLRRFTTPSITYRLTWTGDSRNLAEFQQGFAVYVSENGGAWTKLNSFSAATTSADLTFRDVNKKRKFALVAVAVSGRESERTYFQ